MSSERSPTSYRLALTPMAYIHHPLGYTLWLLYHIAWEGNTTPILVDRIRGDLARRLLQNDRWITPIYQADSKWHRLVHLFFKDLFIPLCVSHSFAAILNNELNCLYLDKSQLRGRLETDKGARSGSSGCGSIPIVRFCAFLEIM